METLRFSYNWNNKLECDSFSTIRLKNDKYKIGSVYDLVLTNHKGEILKQYPKVKLVSISNFLLNELNEAMARIDTGYDKFKCQGIIERMYKNKNVDFTRQQLSFIVLTKKY